MNDNSKNLVFNEIKNNIIYRLVNRAERVPTAIIILPYFTAEAPTSNKRPPPILAKKSCVGLIALELAPTVNYWFQD